MFKENNDAYSDDLSNSENEETEKTIINKNNVKNVNNNFDLNINDPNNSNPIDFDQIINNPKNVRSMNNKRINDEKNANLRKKTSYVSKLFNIKNETNTPRQNECLDVNKIRKEVEAEMLEKVESKVNQLEQQIALLHKERTRMNSLKIELDSRGNKFNEEKQNFNSWKQSQINEFEEWKKEELIKVSKAKKKSDKNTIDLNCALKKSRDENEALREEIRHINIDQSQKEVKFKAQLDRNKKHIDNLNLKSQELEQSLKIAQSND
mmetsp:Transcript_64666/g.54872  ORF Transcript_64666/g.54872 Transcript_64666/m.54872 type:complete len:265 (+) Transcript_64666:681-1475(+)